MDKHVVRAEGSRGGREAIDAEQDGEFEFGGVREGPEKPTQEDGGAAMPREGMRKSSSGTESKVL